MADRKPYLVNNIRLKDEDGVVFKQGEVIRLGDELAAHYNSHNVLSLYIPEKASAPVSEPAAEPVKATPAPTVAATAAAVKK